MVNIFTRQITDNLASLVKQVDTVVGNNKDKKMAAFVVLLSDDPDADADKLKDFSKKHQLENTPVTIFDGVAGPPRYKIAKDADVTVMMWVGRTVKANHAFENGTLNKQSITKVVSDTTKILTAKPKSRKKRKRKK